MNIDKFKHQQFWCEAIRKYPERSSTIESGAPLPA